MLLKNVERFLDELPQREGAQAIYIERPVIALVRVTEVSCNDDEIRAHMEVVPTPGMNECDAKSSEISARWDIFSNFDDQWHASYVSWTVYFGADRLQAGRALAAQAAAGGTTVTLRDMRQTLDKIRQGAAR